MTASRNRRSHPLPRENAFPLGPVVVIALLVVLLLGSALPGYLNGGQWAWKQMPVLTSLKQMQQVPRLGVPLPHWETLEQDGIDILGQAWSRQVLVAKPGSGVAPGTQATLLVHPQLDAKDRPKSEWNSLQRYFGWSEDEGRSVPLSLPGQEKPAEARLVRAWVAERGLTTAVLQWYAWPDGGSARPSHWFWRDRRAQLQNQRTPWMAVTLLLPMEPLGDLEPHRETMVALGESVQAQLIQLWEKTSR